MASILNSRRPSLYEQFNHWQFEVRWSFEAWRARRLADRIAKASNEPTPADTERLINRVSGLVVHQQEQFINSLITNMSEASSAGQRPGAYVTRVGLPILRAAVTNLDKRDSYMGTLAHRYGVSAIISAVTTAPHIAGLIATDTVIVTELESSLSDTYYRPEIDQALNGLASVDLPGTDNLARSSVARISYLIQYARDIRDILSYDLEAIAARPSYYRHLDDKVFNRAGVTICETARANDYPSLAASCQILGYLVTSSTVSQYQKQTAPHWLEQLTRSPAPEVAKSAIWALGRFAKEGYYTDNTLTTLLDATQSWRSDVKFAATTVLGGLAESSGALRVVAREALQGLPGNVSAPTGTEAGFEIR